MSRKTILTAIICMIGYCSAFAAINPKYLKGAVPEVDGKIIFSRNWTLQNPAQKQELFNKLNDWAQKKYKSTGTDYRNHVLLTNPQTGSIACQGHTYLVFKHSTFVLDRADMRYQLIAQIDDKDCKINIRRIVYDYSDSETPMTAEETISDKIALNGQKLNRFYDKFRIFSIDSINAIFNSADKVIAPFSDNAIAIAAQPKAENHEQSNTIATNTQASSVAANGYREITPLQIPGNFLKLLNGQATVITGSDSNAQIATIQNAGLGYIDRQPAIFFEDSKTSNKTPDTFTISFYTEMYSDAIAKYANSGFVNLSEAKTNGLTPFILPSGAKSVREAWLIIECQGIKQNSETNLKYGKITHVWVK